MIGRRVADDTFPADLDPGDYCLRPKASGEQWWFRCPDGSGPTRVDDRWKVTEHEDGTITVEPSIDLSPDGYHGHLIAGVWTP